jgi:hypothetical protein
MRTMCRPTTAAIRKHNVSGVLAVGLFFLFCYPSAPFSQGANTRQVEKQPPLRYRLIVSEPTVCQNEGISLELEVENTSSHRILIDPTALLYSVTISRSGGSVVPTGDRMGKITPDQLVTLEGGSSYRKTISYPLHGKFFVVGLYSIHVTYGQFADFSPKDPDLYIGVVESNTVLFEVTDCGD